MQRACLTAVALWACPALAGSVSLPAQYARNLESSAEQQVCRAARALAAAQKDSSWSWRRGERGSAQNAASVVAVALARVPDACGAPHALDSYLQARVAEHSEWKIIYDSDVEAMALGARALGKPHWAQVAAEAFERRYGGASGIEIVGRWMNDRGGRPALVGFEAANAIRAALAVNDRPKAIDIADAAMRLVRRWGEGRDKHGDATLARGAFLEAVLLLDAHRYAAVAQDLVHHLVLTQGTDGAWGGRNTQATAFAVRGLARWPDEAATNAAALGRKWLRLTQLKDGSWASFNDFLPEPFVGDVIHEVTAEVMLALAGF